MSSAKASADFRSRSAPTTSPTVDINSQGDNALRRMYEVVRSLRTARLARRAGPRGAASVVSVLRSTASGHVPRRVGHGGCPVGSRAIERQYRNRQAAEHRLRST